MMLRKWNKFEDLNEVFRIDPYLPPPRVSFFTFLLKLIMNNKEKQTYN